MLKKNKWKGIISSIIILLPILFGLLMWNELPGTITTHWGADGNADGFSSKAFAIFGLPCILLLLHFLCLLLTMLDKKQKEQNPKALGIIFWIIPIVSLFTNGIVYRAAFGREIDIFFFIPILLGLMFIFMGNYFPKIKQNKTLGIKVSWALQNEENWNKTHRLGGKVWVIGGLVLLISAFLPAKAMVWVMIAVFTAIAVIPICYSYYLYRQHQKAGILYEIPPRSKTEKIVGTISMILVVVLLVGVAVLMFTGDISVNCEATAFRINATYWTDIEVEYAQIDTIEYRKDLDVGTRTNGFGSAKLSMGNFQNGEFGSYTLYAYTGATEFVVLTSDGKTLVIGMSNAKDTQAIFDAISKKIDT